MGAEMPIFARTVSDVAAVTRDEATSASDLSEVVGHDASMASRLLRIAGSTLFNLQGRKIETISAAIVLIGFDAVRELAVSLALIEHVLQGRQHHRVTQHMGRAFHAAAQAKAFARFRKDKCPEEVFVAALLQQLGAMSFWASAAPEGDAIERLVDAGMPMDEAETQVLGFSLRRLTRVLAEEWRLGDLVCQSLDGEHDDNERVLHVALGHEVAETVERCGWDAPETEALLQRLSDDFGIQRHRMQTMVQENLQEATAIAERYGVPKVSDALPPLPEQERAEKAKVMQAGQPDPEFQLKVLTELSEPEGRSLNETMHLILKGIYQGVGFDRAYFALLSPDRKQLQARYVLGRNPDDFAGSSRPLRARGDLFSGLMQAGQAVTMAPGDRAASPENMGWLAYAECALMPIIVSGKPVGVLYADRAASRRSVDDVSFAAFRLFGEQIVTLLSQRR